MADRQEIRKRARAKRREPTAPERALWRMLRDGQAAGLKCRRQVPFGGYIADFVCFNPALIIECDGGQHADSPYDAARDARFVSEGIRVMRFWNGEIIDHPDGVVETILRSIRRGP